MRKVFVKPNPQWPLLRDPVSLKMLDPEGEWKPKNNYWVRRLKFGDVLLGDAPTVEPVVKRYKKKESV